MLSIHDELRTAGDFFAYLSASHDPIKNHSSSNKAINKVYNSWQAQGLHKNRTDTGIDADPFELYQSFFKEISVKATPTPNHSSHFYFIRSRNLNAYAKKMPNGENITVLDNHLIPFLTALALALLTITYADSDSHEKSITENFILLTIRNFSQKSKEQDNKNYSENFIDMTKRNYKLTEIAGYLSTSFLIFIACHEIAHHILGHTNKKTTDMEGNNDYKGCQLIDFNKYDEEFAADSYAYDLFLKSSSKQETGMAFNIPRNFDHSPLLFFEIIQLAQLYQGYKSNKTHPSPLQRKKRLLSSHKQILHPSGASLYNELMPAFEKLGRKIIASLN